MDIILTATSRITYRKILKYMAAILLTLNTTMLCMAGNTQKTALKLSAKELIRDGQNTGRELSQISASMRVAKNHTKQKDYVARIMNNSGKENLYLISAYDNCKLCTGKSPCDKGYGITASGKQAQDGYCAVNWLPFGAKLIIDGKTYTVQDRGAKNLFGDKKHHIKHVDIWFANHAAALRYGVKYKPVTILEG